MLGKVIGSAGYNEAKENVILMAQEQLKRELTEKEIDSIDVMSDLYIDEDPNNTYTFAIGFVE